MWKIQVAQSSNSQSCCKDRQVPLELFPCCFECVLKLRKQYNNYLFRGKSVSSVQHVAPTTVQWGNIHILLFVQETGLALTPMTKLANGLNPSFQHGQVVLCSSRAQGLASQEHWAASATGELAGPDSAFQYTFVTALFILGKLWSVQNCIKYRLSYLKKKRKILKLLFVYLFKTRRILLFCRFSQICCSLLKKKRQKEGWNQVNNLL